MVSAVTGATFSLHHHHLRSTTLHSFSSTKLFPLHSKAATHRLCPGASISSRNLGACDPELRAVLELATNTELYELESILFGPSCFSPLLKSVTISRAEFDRFMIEEDIHHRDHFIGALESQFLFLAADARATLRGWRPSYRNVLLGVRKEFKVPCSSKLCTEDLEAEIFIHLLEDNNSSQSMDQATTAALRVGTSEWRSTLLKLARRLLGKAVLETAKHQIEKDLFRKGGQLAAVNLERQAALLAARKGISSVASGYLGFRSLVQFLGPMLWGTLLADVVIQSLGTDYARILRAIVAFAQIRIMKTYGLQEGERDAIL